MVSVFGLLDDIEAQPGLYLGWSNQERGQQLRELESILIGYGYAIDRHSLDDPGRELLASFGRYLRRKYGFSEAIGPVAAIRDYASDDNDAWDRFWLLIKEYKASLP